MHINTNERIRTKMKVYKSHGGPRTDHYYLRISSLATLENSTKTTAQCKEIWWWELLGKEQKIKTEDPNAAV